MLKLRTTFQIDALAYCDVPRNGSNLERACRCFDIGVKDMFGVSQSTRDWIQRYLTRSRAYTHCKGDPKKAQAII